MTEDREEAMTTLEKKTKNSEDENPHLQRMAESAKTRGSKSSNDDVYIVFRSVSDQVHVYSFKTGEHFVLSGTKPPYEYRYPIVGEYVKYCDGPLLDGSGEQVWTMEIKDRVRGDWQTWPSMKEVQDFVKETIDISYDLGIYGARAFNLPLEKYEPEPEPEVDCGEHEMTTTPEPKKIAWGWVLFVLLIVIVLGIIFGPKLLKRFQKQ